MINEFERQEFWDSHKKSEPNKNYYTEYKITLRVDQNQQTTFKVDKINNLPKLGYVSNEDVVKSENDSDLKMKISNVIDLFIQDKDKLLNQVEK